VTRETQPPDNNSVFMLFTDKSWLPRLEAMRKGDPIAVRGVLERIDRDGIQLTDCQLVDAPPGPTWQPPAPVRHDPESVEAESAE
jgi:hypothetical protein